MALLEAAVEAVELDAFAKEIPDLVFHGTTAYSLFKAEATSIPVSNQSNAGGTVRASFRVPFRVQSGAAISQGTGNADAMGRGTGSQWASFALAPVYLFNVCEISWLAQASTDSKQKGLFAVKAQEMKNSLDAAMQGIEGLINSDGSGMIDQIPAAAIITTGGTGAQTASIAGMNVAVAFSDQQVVAFYSTGGVKRTGTNSSATISYVSGPDNTLYFSTPLPTDVVVTDYIVVNGATYGTGASILGIKAWDVNSNSGTIAGLNRATYPGRLSTPTINLNGAAITPGIAQRAEVLLGRALGPDADSIKSGIWYGPPEQAFAQSNLMYNVQIMQLQGKELAGDKTADMAKKYFADTFGGRKYHKSWTAINNRMDLLVLDNWYIGELSPLELYDFGGGNVVAPVPDISSTTGTASYLTSHMFAYNTCFNLANAAPRAGLYIQNAAVPTV